MLLILLRSCRFDVFSRRALPGLVAVAGLLTLAAAGCRSAGAPAPPAPAPAAAQQAAQPAPAPAPAATGGEATAVGEGTAAGQAASQDGQAETQEWLVDEQGRRYRIERLPKDGHFLRLENSRIRTRWGATVEMVTEDDDFIYYKLYDVSNIKSGSWVENPLTPATKQKILDAYHFDTPDTERVDLVPFASGLPTSGQWRQGFAVADMNGDGHLDIVHGPPRKGPRHPEIFLGDGQGHWQYWKVTYPPIKLDYGDVAVADFNGDGHPDLALAMHLTGIRVMVWDGEGGFRLWTEGTDYGDSAAGGPPRYSARAIRAVDWNGDGRMDLITLGEGPRLEVQRSEAKIDPDSGAYGPVVYLNQGDGTWVRKDQGTGANQVFGDDLAVGDLDGDGLPDFVTSSSKMGWKKIVYRHDASGGWTGEAPDPIRDRAYLRSVTLADFDGDGRLDVGVAFLSSERDTWRSGIDVLLNRGAGRWERHHVFHTDDRDGISALGAGDVDGDGKADLVSATGKRGVDVFLGRGDGSFSRLVTRQPVLEEAKGCRASDVELADLDGDGREEIAVGFAGEGQGWSGIVSVPGCPGTGSLRVWHVEPR